MVFDAYMGKVHEFVEELQAAGRSVKVWDAPVSGLLDKLPIAVGPGANRSIILRGDTYAELGNPEAGSSAVSLFTQETGLVNDGRITLIGPDIESISGQSLPFGQVVLVAGKELLK